MAGTTDGINGGRASRPAWLLLAALAVVLVAAAMVAWVAFGSLSHKDAIDQAHATTLAREFFDGAHGSGAIVTNVQILSISLGNDVPSHSAWKVNISGNVTEVGRTSPSYTSYMWLWVDAESGAVTVFAQG